MCENCCKQNINFNKHKEMRNHGMSGFAMLSGLVLGAAAGLVAGVLLAPKLDAKTKDDFEKMASDAYSKARAMVEEKVAVLKEVGAKIDREKYKKLVEEVTTDLQESREVTAKAAIKLAKELKADWDVAQKEVVKPSAKVSAKKRAK